MTQNTKISNYNNDKVKEVNNRNLTFESDVV